VVSTRASSKKASVRYMQKTIAEIANVQTSCWLIRVYSRKSVTNEVSVLATASR